MSQEPPFGTSFGAPFGAAPPPPSPSPPPPPPPPPPPAAGARRRAAVVAGAGLGVVAVLGLVALVVLDGEDTSSGGAVVARATPTATPTGTTAPPTTARTAARNPFAGRVQTLDPAPGTPAGTAGTAGSTTPAAVTTVVKTVRSVVTTTKTATRTTTATRTRTVTATVTQAPTYVYLLSLTGAGGDAVFVVNGQQKPAASPGDTVVTHLEYVATSSASCVRVSWKAAAPTTLCVGAGTRVDA